MILKSVKLNMLRGRAKRLSRLGVLCLALGLSSCGTVFDDEPDCLHGIALRFVYDYHMQPGANAFGFNVDCVTVLVFDTNGNYVTQFEETSDVLKNDSYRMNLPLENGKYQLVVYGGMACEDRRFNLTPDWRTPEAQEARREDIRVTLPTNGQGESSVLLHNTDDRTGGLFYGTLEVELTDDDYGTAYREETVKLMNDVNNIQIFLQQLNAEEEVNCDDYDFQIVDDNFVLDVNNKAVQTTTGQTVYKPYAKGNIEMGYVDYHGVTGTTLSEDKERPVQVACAEFSTSRLFVEHMSTAKLQITSTKKKDADGNPELLVNIPLIKYLKETRGLGFGDSWIKSDQEYLDRQNRWSLIFFLQEGVWMDYKVSINWWNVHVEHITW